MTASELYHIESSRVDALQKAIHNQVRDQLRMSHELMECQDKMKRLSHIIMKEGDRQLTGIEVVQLQTS